MKRCPFCAEQLQDEARLCRFCGRALPVDCSQLTRFGSRFAIGGLTTGGYAIWNLQTGDAVRRYEPGEKNWQQAWSDFAGAEKEAQPRAFPWWIVIVVVVLAVAYIAFHAY